MPHMWLCLRGDVANVRVETAGQSRRALPSTPVTSTSPGMPHFSIAVCSRPSILIVREALSRSVRRSMVHSLPYKAILSVPFKLQNESAPSGQVEGPSREYAVSRDRVPVPAPRSHLRAREQTFGARELPTPRRLRVYVLYAVTCSRCQKCTGR